MFFPRMLYSFPRKLYSFSFLACLGRCTLSNEMALLPSVSSAKIYGVDLAPPYPPTIPVRFAVSDPIAQFNLPSLILSGFSGLATHGACKSAFGLCIPCDPSCSPRTPSGPFNGRLTSPPSANSMLTSCRELATAHKACTRDWKQERQSDCMFPPSPVSLR